MSTQDAIFHGAGECSSIMLVSHEAVARGDAATVRAMLERAARLMWVMENRAREEQEYAPRNLHVLVALKAALLGGAQPAFSEFPESLKGKQGTMLRGDGSADVLVQVSAGTETDRRYALRLARGIFAGHGVDTPLDPRLLSCREVHGARIFSGLEPFGYRDGGPSEGDGLPPRLMSALRELEERNVPESEWLPELQLGGLLPRTGLADAGRTLKIFQRALRDEKPAHAAQQAPARKATRRTLSADPAERAELRRASREPFERLAQQDVWLLYQRYEHDLDALGHLNPLGDVGRPPLGGDPGAAPPDPKSHVSIAAADLEAGILRRGFPYRNEAGVEGLAFVALADHPEKFGDSLTRHLEADPLLRFTSARASGVYRVPPSSRYVLDVAELDALPNGDPIPPAARVLLRPGKPMPCLSNYQIIPEVLEYVQIARAHGLFLEPTMVLHPEFEEGFAGLEARFGGRELADLRKRIREQSEQLYTFNGSYFSLGI